MKIEKTGKYKLTEPYSTRGSRSTAQLPAGCVIEITQVDPAGHKVIGPDFLDWEHYELPCELVNEESQLRLPGSPGLATGGDVLCFLCHDPGPDHKADWLGGEWVHKDCDREAQRDEERRQMKRGQPPNTEIDDAQP